MTRPRRPRQPQGGIFAVVQTEHGEVLHKLCSGPCGAMKPVEAFYRKAQGPGGRTSCCKACLKPVQSAYGQTEACRAQRRERYRERRRLHGPSGRAHAGCVYLVQLLGHVNTIKIGKTVVLTRRLSTLKWAYGPLHRLLVIPCQDPGKLEKQLQAQLQAFRLYKDEKKTELFQFTTKRGRDALQRILKQYPQDVSAAPLWDIRPSIPETSEEQLRLFG